VSIRYTIAAFGTAQQSKPMSLGRVVRRLARMMRRAGRAKGFRLRRRVGEYGPRRSYSECLSRARILLQAADVGFALVVGVDDGITDQPIRPLAKVRKVSVGYPVADTTGTAQIDAIYGAVVAEFGKLYGIVNLGICANKPGEHSECNAWDIGVSKPRTAEAIHEAILAIANWLRQEMLKDMDDVAGLPVNGVIVMEQVCSRSDPTWHHYSGTPHVSHCHVSGFPSRTGWV